MEDQVASDVASEAPEIPEAARVLEEAYFHINNGGVTLRVVEQVDDPLGLPSNRRIDLEVQACHFGAGLQVKVPLLGRAMVAYLVEALMRTGEYLEANPGIKLHGPFRELEPWYEVVKGTRVPRDPQGATGATDASDDCCTDDPGENITSEMAAALLAPAPVEP